jgi:hypothetical protein
VDYELIDAYLIALRQSLGWRTDIDDVVDEVADHLRENVDRLVATGVAADEAQRRTLACFGELGIVARSFVEAATGDLAVPTRLTRWAGFVGLGASLAWAATIVAGLAGGHTDLVMTWTLQRYEVWAALVTVASALTTLTIAGVLLRTGRIRRPAGVVAVAVGALVTAVFVPLTWVWAVTTVMAPLGLALLSGFRGDAGAADRFVRPVRLFGLAWPLGAVALFLGDEIYRLGPVDSYGDYPVVWLATFLACAGISTAVLAVVGHRLRRERPARLGGTPGRRRPRSSTRDYLPMAEAPAPTTNVVAGAS